MAEENTGRFRRPSGPLYGIEKAIELAIPVVGMFFVLDIPMYVTGTSLYSQQYLGLFLGLTMALTYLLLPATSSGLRKSVPWWDLILAVCSLVVGLYVMVFYPELIRTMGFVTWDKVFLGIMSIFLVVEATRRVAGLPLTFVVIAFILYARYGYVLPDVIAGSHVSWGRLINQLFLGSSSLYGIALRIAALVVFAFVLFAHTLFGFGGGEFLFGAAERLMGRFRGGPAKVSIVASAFFAMLSGSAVANVAGTGTITIPLMKRTGYSPEFASAVEAVASTGGTITPPVMGAAAFIIAEFLGLSYSDVVVIAIVPAMLYYLSLFVQVDLRAVKKGLEGIPKSEQVPLKPLLAKGWICGVAFAVLVYCLFVLYLRPEVSALYALASLIVLGTIQKVTRIGPGKFLEILRNTSRGMLEITVIGAAAGIVIGVVNYTGLGLSLSRLLTDLAGGSLLLLAIMTAITSVILGMGVPVTASYLLLAVLAAPALVEMGVPALAAHMFIFYFGTFSFITPPVCLAAYTAASIGEANQMRTAVTGMRLAIAGYLIPFIFIFEPAVVLQGELGEIVISVSLAIIAIVAASFALENYFLRELGWWRRILYAGSALALLIPSSWPVSAAGVCIIVALLLSDIWAVRGPGKKPLLEGEAF